MTHPRISHRSAFSATGRAAFVASLALVVCVQSLFAAADEPTSSSEPSSVSTDSTSSPNDPAVDSKQPVEKATLLVQPLDPENLGELPPGQLAMRRVKVVNVSSREIELSILKKTCGCLDVKIENTRLKPQESTTLTISVLTIEASGTQAQAVSLGAAPVPSSPSTSATESTPPTETKPVKSHVDIALSYTPSVKWVLRPKVVPIDACAGETAYFSVYLRRTDQDQPIPMVDEQGVDIQDEAGGPAAWCKLLLIRPIPANPGCQELIFQVRSQQPTRNHGRITVKSPNAGTHTFDVHFRVTEAVRTEPEAIILVEQSQAVSVPLRFFGPPDAIERLLRSGSFSDQGVNGNRFKLATRDPRATLVNGWESILVDATIDTSTLTGDPEKDAIEFLDNQGNRLARLDRLTPPKKATQIPPMNTPLPSIPAQP